MSAAGKHVQNGTYEFDYMRAPDSRSNWQIFKDGLYNPREGTVLGHTGKQWGVTGIFYFCFFSGLALFFAICLKGLMATLSDEKPKWILDSSLIGSSPGLGFRPISENVQERSLIWYDKNNDTQVQMWVKRLDLFLASYQNTSLLPARGENQEKCYFGHSIRPGAVCKVDEKEWGDCSPKNGYGYKNSQPCIFIKLNKIYGWIPEYYNNKVELPKDMPEELKAHISNLDDSQLNTVWLSCKGENPHDHESIVEIKYFPKSPQGFPGYYFPYENQQDYISPLVAVQLTKVKSGILINIECRAWAKNIKYSSHRSERMGQVHFEILIDPPPFNSAEA